MCLLLKQHLCATICNANVPTVLLPRIYSLFTRLDLALTQVDMLLNSASFQHYWQSIQANYNPPPPLLLPVPTWALPSGHLCSCQGSWSILALKVHVTCHSKQLCQTISC
eukprot:GGOE01025783.1.p1 GENE.GGOE01025783.1~~GGOE01025783.1.p1  ORF type:complete len:110 (+),score=7.57 GGOE01025783.1:383-712(+)